MLLSQVAGKRLTYSALTGKDSLPEEVPFGDAGFKIPWKKGAEKVC